jgi:hypothetical protein
LISALTGTVKIGINLPEIEALRAQSPRVVNGSHVIRKSCTGFVSRNFAVLAVRP